MIPLPTRYADLEAFARERQRAVEYLCHRVAAAAEVLGRVANRLPVCRCELLAVQAECEEAKAHQDFEVVTLDCGCEMTKGWRCPVHSHP